MSRDRHEQQRPRQEDDDNNKDHDDDEYDDDDDDYENTSIEFSGEALGEGLGGRRDVLDKYDEPFYSTQRQSSSSYPRTKTSESRINKDAILRATNGQPPSTLFHFSVVLSNENKNFFDRREKGFRDKNRAVTGADISTDLLDRSSSSSFAASSSSDESYRRTVSSHLLSCLVVFCVLARRDRV